VVGEVAPLVDGEGVTKPPLLLYLADARDLQGLAVAPALAALAERAGWEFELYYDDFRAGRHFGGGPPERARAGWPAGSLVAGGRHADHARRLTVAYTVVAVGDPASVLWPALTEAESLLRTTDPARLYEAAFDRLGQPLPREVLVVDGSPQGAARVVVAPFLYPAFFTGSPVLGLEASATGPLGDRSHRGLYVTPDRAEWLRDRDGDASSESYAGLTAALAERHAAWGKGILMGDPALVAAQLPRARRLRLVPIYGRPQIDVLRAAAPLVRAAAEPVWGRQYDDRDFLELAELGHGLQVLDPDPPFGAMPGGELPPAGTEPDDEHLRRWAAEGQVLATLVFWAGMAREAHCLAPLVDLVAATGLHAGVVLTVPALDAADPAALALLGAPRERGGVAGLLEPLAGSTGYGVAAETLLPDGTLSRTLADARAAGLGVRGWWPLLDAPLVPHTPARVERRGLRPVIRFSSRGGNASLPDTSERQAPGRVRDVRGLAGHAVRRVGLEQLFEEWRPFDDRRPGALDRRVVDAVRGAGFQYMWTKSAFGQPRVAAREGDFVALPFTAGNWDGWSPFYTVASATDVAAAERRLLKRGGAGWLASTVDSPLFLLPGELLQHGSRLHELAEFVARGGRSGRLVNVTPNVVARYARLL
jgi:hypothetical protein